MKTVIAIPAYHCRCKVFIDQGRAWSVLDELLLWSVHEQRQTIDELAASASLPQAMIVASIARMMRFRLVDLALVDGRAGFGATDIGASYVGRPLPFFPKRIGRHVSFVVERATGELWRRRDVRLAPLSTLEKQRQRGVDVRIVTVTGGVPSMSSEANMQRLAALAVRGHDEHLAGYDSRTASRRDDEALVIEVVDDQVSGLPKGTASALRSIVEELAKGRDRGDVTIAYAGARDDCREITTSVRCSIRPEDVLVGGEAHKQTFLEILRLAEHQVIVHSTFIAHDRFDNLREAIREACRRGVCIDVLWGADDDNETPNANAHAASAIMNAVRGDADLAGRVRVHMRSTGSHAKLVLSDGPNGRWLAVVGSCNWLLSPFRSVELSAVLHDSRAVAMIARALSRLVGRKGAAFGELEPSLTILADTLEAGPSSHAAPNGSVTLVEGQAHEAIAREASGAARHRLVFGSHRLGATARPGALLQCMAAAAREQMDATVIYTRASGPLKRADARELEREMAALGVRLIAQTGVPLHGKFLAWDDDDIVVTSFNWASATVDSAFPQSEIGVHVRAPGLGADVLRRVAEKLPGLVFAERQSR